MKEHCYICYALSEEDKIKFNTQEDYIGVFCDYGNDVAETLLTYYNYNDKVYCLIVLNRRDIDSLGKYIDTTRFADISHTEMRKRIDDETYVGTHAIFFSDKDFNDYDKFCVTNYIYIFKYNRWFAYKNIGNFWYPQFTCAENELSKIKGKYKTMYNRNI